MTVVQLLIIVVVGVFLYLIIRPLNERYAVFILLGGGVIILYYTALKMASVFAFIEQLAASAGINNQYFSIVLKGLSICYLCEFVSGICRDCGLNGWSGKAELACRCALLVLAIPLFEDFLNIIIRLME